MARDTRYWGVIATVTVIGRLQIDGYLTSDYTSSGLSADEINNIASFTSQLKAPSQALSADDLNNLTSVEKYYYGEGIVLSNAYDDPNVVERLDDMEQGVAGPAIVVGLRTVTPEFANNGKGVYDDTLIVMQRSSDGTESGVSFAYNADPSGQYDARASQVNGILKYGSRMNAEEQSEWSSVTLRKIDGVDINGDGIPDEGALAADSYYFSPKPGGYIQSKQYYDGQNAPAWMSTDVEGADRITGFDGVLSYSSNDFDPTGAGTTMYFHIGGNINTYSAGCQTIPGAQFSNFVSAVGGRNASFYYVLTNTQGG